MAGTTRGGHLGGTFSCVDILVYLFYSKNFKFGSFADYHDVFLLSKGHACLAFYNLLREKEVISQQDLENYFLDGGLGAQLDVNVPWVHWNSGSLGHTVSICAGFAIYKNLREPSCKSVTLIGDSELMEGSVWEAIIFAGQLGLKNLYVIIDHNKLSVTSKIDSENKLFVDLGVKIRALGWDYFEVDGHSIFDIEVLFNSINGSDKPKMILAHTVKGKGVKFMEGNPYWHHSRPTQEQFNEAVSELKKAIRE